MVPILEYLEIIKGEEVKDIDKIKLPKKIKIDNFVYDIHTGNKKTDMVTFALEGSKVDRELPFVNKIWKKIFIQSKYLQEGRYSEIEGYLDN